MVSPARLETQCLEVGNGVCWSVSFLCPCSKPPCHSFIHSIKSCVPVLGEKGWIGEQKKETETFPTSTRTLETLNVALSSWRPWCREANCADDPLCTFPTGHSANLTTSIQRGSALPVFQMGGFKRGGCGQGYRAKYLHLLGSPSIITQQKSSKGRGSSRLRKERALC